MGFNLEGFRSVEAQPRTEAVRVDDLADWFDGEPIWTVRGLTYDEIAKADAAADKTKTLTALVESLASSDSVREKVTLMKDVLGFGDDSSPQAIRRLEMFVIASVDPVIELDVAVKLSNTNPVIFKELTDKIFVLTGQGQILGKQKPSGKTGVSEVA